VDRDARRRPEPVPGGPVLQLPRQGGTAGTQRRPPAGG
jgi:hypothetical protein